MDASHLGEQIEGSIDQLHILFDEIGVPTQEREKRETELFVALSEALNRYVRLVGTEKKDLIDEAKKTIVAIRQMETSLEDPKRRESGEREDFKITFPLVRCLQGLRERHGQVARLHKERYEQVMKLAEALESYSSHLEPAFVQIALPPMGPNRSMPLTFDLSPSYVHRLDSEFTRVYDEYTRRLAAVQALGEHIVQLWAELGIPQNQQDAAINKYHRDAPEQLGLHQEDINRLSSVRDKLAEEKKSREKRLLTLKAAIEDLWEKLGVPDEETKAFLQENEGYGIRQISEFEAELERLNELKRQNLQYFIEDTRITLQELWDSLYFSEDDMLEFAPAFSDAYSDALLEAHEREVKRLAALKEERAPTLTAVAKYKGLIKDRDELIATSQDSSRLMLRGQKGEKRDPGKLLREEKTRKRVAKELPRVLVEVREALEQWEEEHGGKPFLVYGERFLNEIEAEEETATAASAKRPPPRTRTPAPALTAVRMPGSAQARATSSHSNASSTAAAAAAGPSSKSVPSRNLLKTPSAHEAATKKVFQSQQGPPSQAAVRRGAKDSAGSPSKVPARAPLSSLRHGANSPDRRPKQQQQQQQQQPQQLTKQQTDQPQSQPKTEQHQIETFSSGAPIRAPPPKMRSLKPVPDLNASQSSLVSSTSSRNPVVRAPEPEDAYDDYRAPSIRSVQSSSSLSQRPVSSHSSEDFYSSSIRLLPPLPPPTRQQLRPQQQPQQQQQQQHPREHPQHQHQHQHQQRAKHAPTVPRQSSYTSQATTLSGSENWETFDDYSEPEDDVSDDYYSKLRAAGEKRLSPDQSHRPASSPPKRMKGPRLLGAAAAAPVVVDDEGQRLASGSEWADEETF